MSELAGKTIVVAEIREEDMLTLFFEKRGAAALHVKVTSSVRGEWVHALVGAASVPSPLSSPVLERSRLLSIGQTRSA
jgi:hypothetical protein